jgi:hypothetical protein
MDALVVAASATAALMLVNRGLGRFGLSIETKAWMGLAWLLIIVGGTFVASALQR